MNRSAAAAKRGTAGGIPPVIHLPPSAATFAPESLLRGLAVLCATDIARDLTARRVSSETLKRARAVVAALEQLIGGER